MSNKHHSGCPYCGQHTQVLGIDVVTHETVRVCRWCPAFFNWKWEYVSSFSYMGRRTVITTTPWDERNENRIGNKIPNIPRRVAMGGIA